MSNQITYHLVSNLPSDDQLLVGGMYFTTQGEQYIIGSGKSKLKITSVEFPDTLPTYGSPDRLYVIDNKIKIWSGTSYVDIGGGEEFDSSQLEADIIALQSSLDAVEGKVTNLESLSTTLQNNVSSNTTDIQTLNTKVGNTETKISELESEIDNLSSVDLSQLETDLTQAKSDITTLQTDVSTNTQTSISNASKISIIEGEISTINSEIDGIENDITTLNTRVDNLSNITNVQEDIVETENDLPTSSDTIGDLVLVRSDSTQDNSPSFYRWNGTSWDFISVIDSDVARDFIAQPIDLVTEITGILSKSSYEKQNATDTEITDSANKFTATDVENVLVEIDDKIIVTNSNVDTLTSRVDTLEASNTVDVGALETKVNGIESDVNALDSRVETLENTTVDFSPLQSQIDGLGTRIETIENEKKTSTIVFSTNDVSVGFKPSIVEVPYTSSIISTKSIITNDAGADVTFDIEKSTDGLTWTSLFSDSIAVGSVIKTSNQMTILTKHDLLRLNITSDNEDVSGLTVNITIEEQ